MSENEPIPDVFTNEKSQDVPDLPAIVNKRSSRNPEMSENELISDVCTNEKTGDVPDVPAIVNNTSSQTFRNVRK